MLIVVIFLFFFFFFSLLLLHSARVYLIDGDLNVQWCRFHNNKWGIHRLSEFRVFYAVLTVRFAKFMEAIENVKQELYWKCFILWRSVLLNLFVFFKNWFGGFWKCGMGWWPHAARILSYFNWIDGKIYQIHQKFKKELCWRKSKGYFGYKYLWMLSILWLISRILKNIAAIFKQCSLLLESSLSWNLELLIENIRQKLCWIH